MSYRIDIGRSAYHRVKPQEDQRVDCSRLTPFPPVDCVVVFNNSDGSERSRHLESALRSKPISFDPLFVRMFNDFEPDDGSDIGYCREAVVRKVVAK